MKNIYLIMSTGRCGTHKLQTIFATVPGIFCERNPFPPISLWRIPSIYEPGLAHEFVQKKLDYFYNDPAYNQYHSIMITGHETGSNFIKSFLHNNCVPNLVILRRTAREVATSLYKLNWIPGRTKIMQRYFNSPDEPGVLPYKGWETAHPYQLCYWYCFEIEQRARYYKPLLERLGGKVYDLTTREMLQVDGFNKMLDYFGFSNLDYIDQTKENEYEYYHEWLQHRKVVPPDDYLESLEQQVLDNIPAEFKQYLIDNNLT